MANDDSENQFDEEDFSWTEYLKETCSEAADPSCFCQHLIPPINEFKVGYKLETFDPRNTTSTCIGTVIEVSGPRIRLRLDGTDDRNDFWLMCDSDLIHPFGYSSKNNRKIQPPLGFGNDLSKWPKFLEKIINTASDGVFAPDSCFKPPPPRLLKNDFKVGQKIEAVDPKNPHLICPATIKEVTMPKLLVTFDGWSQSSQFWCAYGSRDLFPVGWCKKAGHTLQYPGNLEDKHVSIKDTTVNLSPALSLIAKQTKQSNASAKSKTNVKAIPVRPSLSTDTPIDKENQKQKRNSISANEMNISSIDTINTSKTISKSSRTHQKLSSTEKTLSQQATSTPISTNTSNVSSKLSPQKIKNEKSIHLTSLVKAEPMDPLENTNKLNGNETNDSNNKHILIDSNKQNLISSSTSNNYQSLANVIVFVNPQGDCGPLIKTNKFHASHKQFGPGIASSIYKSIVQSFIDCALNRFDVFKLVPEGKSNDIVRLKTINFNEKKTLNKIENLADMWKYIKEFCKLIQIDDSQLFSNKYQNFSKKTHENKNEKNLESENSVNKTGSNIDATEAVKPALTLPLTPQASSSSSASSSSTSSVSSSCSNSSNYLNTNSNKQQSNETSTITKSTAQKRRSSSSSNHPHVDMAVSVSIQSNENNTCNTKTNDLSSENNSTNPNHAQPKSLKLDPGLDAIPITEWSIDNVVYYIYNIGENYFSSYVDIFRHHEIDGKALLLLTTDILMKYMGFKLGPALKLNNFLDKLRCNFLKLES